MQHLRRAAWIAAAVTTTLVVAGCGGDDEDSATTEASGTTSGIVEEAKANVEKGYEGTFREPPSSGPPAQKGKNVWVIPCVASAPGCQGPAEGLKEAGKELGWKVTIADGKADPGVQNSMIKRAIAAGADGIATVAIDCANIKTGLREAKAKKVPVVNVYAFDCDDPSVGDEALFSPSNLYGESPADYFRRWGTMTADYLIAQTDGDAEIVSMTGPGFRNAAYKDEAFVERLKQCDGCEVVATIPSPVTDNASGLVGQKIQTALQKHPDASVLALWADSKTVVASQVIRTAKRRNTDLLVSGGEGNLENMELIRDGTQDVAVGVPPVWLGWAGADTLNRLFAGETEQPDQGIGFMYITKDRNLPEPGKPWEPSIDFRAAYKKLWAGS